MTTMQRQPDDVGAGSEPAKEEGEAGLARTDIYDVLSNERRTMVLELLAAGDPQDLGDLAEEIAARETGERPPPRNKRTSVYVTLHQTHLPKLANLSIVEYDDREKVVSLGSRASTVLAQQEGGSTESAAPGARWSELSLAVAASGLGLAGGSAIGLPGLASLSAGAYAVATLAVLVALLAFHVARNGAGVPFDPPLLNR